MMIKVCGITRREDALAAAEAGASAIGFIFYPKSPRYITPERAAELGEGLKLWKVGIFVNESPVTVGAVMRAAKLDVAQLYGGEAPAGVRVWQAFRVTESFQPPRDGGAEAILLDGVKNGAPFDWKLARGMGGKVIVAGGLNAENVAEAIRIAQPWGVDASSSSNPRPASRIMKKCAPS